MKSITDVREDLLRKVHLVHPCKELVLVVHSGQEHQLHEGSHCTSSDLLLVEGPRMIWDGPRNYSMYGGGS